MNLQAFLNPIKEENIKFVASKRFVDDGKLVEWELRALSSTEDKEIRKSCTRKVPVPGKKHQFMNDFDTEKYLSATAAACTVFPNLNDATLQDAYHVMGAEELLLALLNPGEYSGYVQKVQEINGFDTSIEELVEEAKN